MTVLMVAPYIYVKEWQEFTRNRTGFGIMVRDIFESVSKKENTYILTQVITRGHGRVVKHSWSDVFFSARFSDWKKGVKFFFRYKQDFKNRCKYFYYGLNAGTLVRKIRELKPDIVHIHGLRIQEKPFIDVCEELGVPYIVTLHGLNGLDESVKVPQWDKDFEREFLLKADKEGIPVTVISSGMKTRIEKNYLLHNSGNITVVCNGTTMKGYEKDNIEELDLREKYCQNGEKIVVVIGSLCERKNQIQIVDAFATGIITTPCKVFFCGKDVTNNEVENRIKEYGLSDKIHLLGFVPQKIIVQVLNQADLNVVASRDEGFGLSIIEAYCQGVPTVTFSDLDAVPDLYSEDTMITIDKRDTDELARGIEKGLQAEWDREKIKEYSKKFGLEETADKYVSLYLQYKRV